MFKNFFLSSGKIRRLFYLLWWESSFAVAYETWIHPNYLMGLAGELNIPLRFVSILAAIPWIGASGQVIGLWAFDRSGSAKRYVLGMASLGRALWLIPLVLALFWVRRTYQFGVPFPTSSWFLLAALCACMSSLMTSASANAWMYWMKGTIPSKLNGRFFGNRQRFTTSAFILASLVGSLLVGWNPQGYRIGLGLLCLFALASGFCSIYLHSFVQDIPIQRETGKRSKSIISILRKPLCDPEFRDLLVFGAQFNGAIQLVNSYLPYYFTKDLNISMSTVAIWTAISNLGCFTAAAFWGKRADKVQAPYEILWYTGHLIAFSPLVYFFLKHKNQVLLAAPVEYFGYGLAWSGFLLAQTKLLFRLSPNKPSSECAAYFSTYAAVCGLSGAICTFLGGQLAQLFSHWGGFRALWLFGCIARLTILWIFCRPLLEDRKSLFRVPELQRS